ncbi:hypothetical protein MSIM_22860 [Mycobacterium simiae]|nr:hypothetical protein MSIM_22860 [Mycobacterium simiae]
MIRDHPYLTGFSGALCAGSITEFRCGPAQYLGFKASRDVVAEITDDARGRAMLSAETDARSRWKPSARWPGAYRSRRTACSRGPIGPR